MACRTRSRRRAAYALQKGPGVFALHSIFGHVFEYVRAEGLSAFSPEAYACVTEKPLQNLEGETPAGDLVPGSDYWRSREDAVTAYSSHAGRRVLFARIQNCLSSRCNKPHPGALMCREDSASLAPSRLIESALGKDVGDKQIAVTDGGL